MNMICLKFIQEIGSAHLRIWMKMLCMSFKWRCLEVRNLMEFGLINPILFYQVGSVVCCCIYILILTRCNSVKQSMILVH